MNTPMTTTPAVSHTRSDMTPGPTTTRVRVPHPEQWWVAARDDLPPGALLPPEDDGPTDGYDMPDERRWVLVAAVVHAVAHALVTEAYALDPDDPTSARVHVDVGGLDRLERSIVRSWFEPGSGGPCGDAWSGELRDGRHRLRTMWLAEPQALLPVRSEVLRYLDGVPLLGEALTHVLAHGAAEGLPLLPDAISARNPRYVDALQRLAGRRLRTSGAPSSSPVSMPGDQASVRV